MRFGQQKWVTLSCGLMFSIGYGAFAQAPVPAPSPAAVTQSTDPGANEKFNQEKPKNPALPTLWLVGDSTVRNGHADGAHGQWGWGEPLQTFFDPAKINVVNRAVGGRSSRTFLTEGHWGEVLSMLKKGDFMLIQFGHNDSGPLDDTGRARGTLPGVGEESREIENPILKRHETVHTFGWYIRDFVHEARARGVTVIVCSLIPRKTWKDGHVVRGSGDTYGGWAEKVATQEHVGFIDLNEIIGREYDALGESAVEPLFADPHTHTSLAGATMNARAVITGFKLLKPDPVAAFLSPAAAEIPASMPPAH